MSTFSASQVQNVIGTYNVFRSFTCKNASRQDDVQFCISHLARWLRAHRFRQPTLRPSRATNHLKNAGIGKFSTFLRACIVSLDSFSSVIFASLLCCSLTLQGSAFFVGGLTPKLPSVSRSDHKCYFLWVIVPYMERFHDYKGACHFIDGVNIWF